MSKFEIVASRVRMAARIDAADGKFNPGGTVRRELDGIWVSKYHYRRLCEEYGAAFAAWKPEPGFYEYDLPEVSAP